MEFDGSGVDVALVEPGTVRTDYEERSRETMDGLATSSNYAEGYRRVDLAQRLSRRFGLEPEVVPETIREAAVATNSKRRYVIGRDARLLLALDRLPGNVLERAISVLG